MAIHQSDQIHPQNTPDPDVFIHPADTIHPSDVQAEVEKLAEELIAGMEKLEALATFVSVEAEILPLEPVFTYQVKEQLPHATWSKLEKAGYGNDQLLKCATDEELVEIKGIGPATVEQIREVLS